MNKIIINIILIFSMLSMLTSCNTASSSSDQDVYHPLKVSSGRWSEIQSVNIYYYAHSAMLSQEETEAISIVFSTLKHNFPSCGISKTFGSKLHKDFND